MKFCTECGTNVEGMKFCPECGTKIISAPVLNEKLSISHTENVNYINSFNQDDDVWFPPEEFYAKHNKHYSTNDKLLQAAINHDFIKNKDELLIGYGSYSSSINYVCILILKSQKIILASLNENKPGFNIIKEFDENNFNDLLATYNPKKRKFDTVDLLGFKLSKANEISVTKLYITYFELLSLLSPNLAKAYFDAVLASTFKTAKQIELTKQKQEVLKKQVYDKYKENIKQKEDEKNRLKDMKANKIPYCPKCHSTSLSANKKGFGIGKAVIGAAATGGIGLVAGNINAKKVRLTCMNCGHQFWPGK